MSNVDSACGSTAGEGFWPAVGSPETTSIPLYGPDCIQKSKKQNQQKKLKNRIENMILLYQDKKYVYFFINFVIISKIVFQWHVDITVFLLFWNMTTMLYFSHDL